MTTSSTDLDQARVMIDAVPTLGPVAQLGIAEREDLRPIADEVKARLERVLAAV